MSKAKIIDKKSVDSVLGEKNLLSQLHHPFIVNMVYSFQDHDYLYLVMDLLPGGNLRYHISLKRHFNEKQNKFLIGCILVGLEYIHGEKILHRDIKPENLVFDSHGYLRITDFGIAKKYTVNNKKDTSGTVGYLAPEVLCNENHNYSIDYYAIGIIAYELAYGHRPYIGKTKHEVKQLILTKQAHLEYDDLPDGYQDEAADFINKLIQRKPKNRLGKDSINEVINHPWLRSLDWAKIKNKSLRAYYIPKEGDNYDKKYCLQKNKMGEETIERYKEIISDPNYDIIFRNFDCEKVPDELKIINDNVAGDTNNVNFSSNNSTTSISKNNKINASINDNIKKNRNYSLEKQRNKNKSMENIFIKENKNKDEENINKFSSYQKNDNNNKSLNKQKSEINNNDKEKEKENNNENNLEVDNENDKENIDNNNFDLKNKKLIFNKKQDNNNNNKFSFRKKNNYNENNDIFKLKSTNKNPFNNHSISPSISSILKEKKPLLENFGDLSSIKRNKMRHKDKDANIERDKNSLILKNNTQRMTNLSQYISNNVNQKNIKKNNKFLSSSNSSLNLLQNELFSNLKGNYFKKILNGKLVSEEPHKLKNKSNNSLYASSSSKSLFQNNSIININNSKKNFLKRELFNGTFYPNNSGSKKFFVINSNSKKRKSSSMTLIKKNNDNKKLTSSSSMTNLKINKNENRENSPNDIFSVLDFSNIQNKNKKFVDKQLPFINMTVNKKNGSIFRNNLRFIKRNKNKIILNSNGFFSERLKKNEKQSSINDNNINNK